jgi:predicted acetyltransferase
MKRTRHEMDIDYNVNEYFIMVKTNVKISADKTSQDIFGRNIF